MSILQYGFMQRAFLVGILLAVITPCIGITIVLKRMSMIGDALSHSSLAGVVLGLILGVNPVAGAVVMCIVAALGIEAIRKKIPRYSEVAISIVMSAGIGLAGVLSGFVENGASLNSCLFNKIPIPSHNAYATPRAIFLTAKERKIYEAAIITSIKINPLLSSLTLAHFIDNVPVISAAIARPNKIQ